MAVDVAGTRPGRSAPARPERGGGRRRWSSRPSPSWRAAPWRLLGSGAWGLLVVLALLLLSVAAAVAPLFYEAAANAAWRSTLSAVPDTARVADAPVVRLNGGAVLDPGVQERRLEDLRAIPGLGEPTVVGGSVGKELVGRDTLFRPVASAGGRVERARLYADGDLAGALVPAAGSPAPADDVPGLWLPVPLAERLGLGPGDPFDVGVVRRADPPEPEPGAPVQEQPPGPQPAETVSAPTRVAGVYEVAADGRTPAEPPTTRRWTLRAGQLPPDTELTTLPSYLLVGDTATVQRLALEVGDSLFWVAEARLDPPAPPLADAERTAAAVDRLRDLTIDPRSADASGPLRLGLVSGLPDLVVEAQAVRDATVARTSTLAWASVVLGLLAVTAVAVLGAQRRRVELALGAGLGVPPWRVGAQAALELLPAAVVVTLVAPLLARGVLALLGFPRQFATAVVVAAYTGVAQALLAAIAVVALVAAAAAAIAGRPPRDRAEGRRLPWELLVGVAAGTAVLGLAGRPARATPGVLDLLVPVLVAAAAGAVGGQLLLRGTAVVARRLGSGRPQSRRGAVSWLALRRLAAPGEARLLVLTLLTTALAMQLYAVTAAAAVDDVTADRAAVVAGAAATAEVDGSWLLDDDPVDRPLREPGEYFEPLVIPPVSTPALPAGTSLVWRDRAQVVNVFGDVQVMVVEADRFADTAAWGQGDELGRARSRLADLAAADARSQQQFESGQQAQPVPVLVVGPTELRAGQQASIDLALEVVPIDVLAVLPAFPGAEPGRTTVVLGESVLPRLLDKDPRFRPPPRDLASTDFATELWSAGGPDGLDEVLAARGVEPDDLATLEQARQRPDLVAARRSLGYQLALAACVAAVAVLAVCLYADRAAARGRPADLLLRRAGLGRAGPLQARVVEIALTGATALLLAGAAVALVSPRAAELVDGGGGAVPALAFTPTAVGVALTVATTAVAVLAAAVVTAVRGRTGTEGQVLRDAE